MEKQIEDLKAIREMMEKSTKFLSLSGLSGITAGITAICGAAFAYIYLSQNQNSLIGSVNKQDIFIITVDALVVLVLSLFFAFYFSKKNAKKKNQKLFNKATVNTIYNLSIPLATGGIFCLIMLYHGYIELVSASTLIFYGLALVNASKYTYNEIHYLGITEVFLGLLAAFFIHKYLFFWVLGFGICHIVYGIIMYNKYDLK